MPCQEASPMCTKVHIPVFHKRWSTHKMKKPIKCWLQLRSNMVDGLVQTFTAFYLQRGYFLMGEEAATHFQNLKTSNGSPWCFYSSLFICQCSILDLAGTVSITNVSVAVECWWCPFILTDPPSAAGTTADPLCADPLWQGRMLQCSVLRSGEFQCDGEMEEGNKGSLAWAVL